MSLVKLMAVGDISLQTVNDRHPFKNVRKLFGDKDILFGNLETVLSNRGQEVERTCPLHTSSGQVIYLKDTSFDILNIANNHIMDLGPEGFNETLEVLNQNGLTFIGAGSQKFRQSSAIIERRDIKFGFLGYCICGFKNSKEEIFINKEKVVDNIRNLNSTCDFVIVSLHWGTENVFYPSPKQVNLAHKLIDVGATVILGHHPHVIQGIEQYKNGLIAYSLGNFQFDPKLSYSKTNKSIILCLNFSKKELKSYDIFPIIIDQDFLPCIVDGKAKNEMEDFINKISQPIIRKELTERWWFEEIAGEYLLGNMKSFVIRIKKYGIKHLFQCIKWLISPFVIKCYMGMLRRKLKGYD